MLFLIVSLVFFVICIRNILFWVGLWQEREYRLDRLRVHILETSKGRYIFITPITWLYSILFVIAGWALSTHYSRSWYPLIVVVLFINFGEIIIEIIQLRLKRPHLTMKAKLLCILSFFTICVLYSTPLFEWRVWLIFLILITWVIVALFVLLFAIPTRLYLGLIIRKAAAYLALQKQITVIAISGSYGKSSTKEYIAQVLAARFSVVKTPLSNNTPIGIARTILSQINKMTQIFIVEVGAYKKGEVAEICRIVRPQISVTTSVSDQHLSLFGSFDQVIETEEELIHALPQDGVALFNATNNGSMLLADRTKKEKLFYIVAKERTIKLKGITQKNAIVATNVRVFADHVSFSVTYQGKQTIYTAPLLGSHSVENILPAILFGYRFGLSTNDIKKQIAQLVPPPKTLTRIVTKTSIILLDDTFNASPESVRSAVTYMQLYKKKRYIVLNPLIELGEHSRKRHQDIGHLLSTTVDGIFLTNKNFYNDIIAGIGEKKVPVFVGNAKELIEKIETVLVKGDVVLCEGKEAGGVLEYLKSTM